MTPVTCCGPRSGEATPAGVLNNREGEYDGRHDSATDIVAGPGGKQILVEDPAGNVVELFEPAR